MGRYWGVRIVAVVLGVLAVAVESQADFAVQVGAYSRNSHFFRAQDTLAQAGFPILLQEIQGAGGRRLTRLMVGPYPTYRDAKALLPRLERLGYAGFIRKVAPSARPWVPKTPRVNKPKRRPAPPPPPVSQPPKPVVRPPVSQPEPPAPARQPAPAPATPPPPQLNELPLEPPPPPELDDLSGPVFPAPLESDTIDLLLGLSAAAQPPPVTGFYQTDLAYTLPRPSHLSKFRHLLELSKRGRWGRRTAWKVSGRASYDLAFALDDYYPGAVAEDQRSHLSLRETYLDVPAGAWDFRLGRQHIVWGEMVGLFFADVVSARDMREFVLQDFSLLRIPQWAARGEYFKGDFHAEAILIPYPSYDEIGAPGAEFYPWPPPPPEGYGLRIEDERKPAGDAAQVGYGLRLSYLHSGWDTAVFFYSSMDAQPYFPRSIESGPVPTVVYRPDHDRIFQLGTTVAKDFEPWLLRLEAVYTKDRWYSVTRAADADGVVRQDSVDYALGMERSFDDLRLNVQLFQRWFPSHDEDILLDAMETGYSLYLSNKFMRGELEPQLLIIGSLNRDDWLYRPKVVWLPNGNWQIVFGVDVLDGSPRGVFGRFNDSDRVYTEWRYMF